MNKDAWDQLEMTAYTVNGLYRPFKNDITVTAGILGGEYYNEDMSYEQMLGGIGMIIGHEITHAFDNVGAKYDKNGALVNWWTDEDYAAFQARAGKLADWYDGFIPCEGTQFTGQQVQREAIADLGSMYQESALREEEALKDSVYVTFENMLHRASADATRARQEYESGKYEDWPRERAESISVLTFDSLLEKIEPDYFPSANIKVRDHGALRSLVWNEEVMSPPLTPGPFPHLAYWFSL